MVDELLIYEEVWPHGRTMHLRLTSQRFMVSLFRSFVPLKTIPLASIRWIATNRVFLDKTLAINYYPTSTTFDTITYSVNDMAAWEKAFQTVGIPVHT